MRPLRPKRATAQAVAACCMSLSPALTCTAAPPSPLAPRVVLPQGVIEGARTNAGGKAVHAFLGIPYAAPPIGDMRWREPQPLARWAGVRDAKNFGPRCMQRPLGRMTFRSKEMSEDCLYLNVWAPATDAEERVPVLIYFHGGGFVAGDGSEPRYDGANFAARRVVTVTVNYRLGVFGFMAHPDARSESSSGGSGNYGLLDQHAALRWVRENIARFGGDPTRITIAGESAGAVSVSAHMASPLSRDLFTRAIGQSGGAFAPLHFWSRGRAEHFAGAFARRVGAPSLEALRTLDAEKLLLATVTQNAEDEDPAFPFWPSIDGHFLRASPESIFRDGAQARVPLLLGTNSQESDFPEVLQSASPTPENWRNAVKTLFGDWADEALLHYPGNDPQQVMRSGTALASDLFVTHSTWRWMDLHRKTGQMPVYCYYYVQPRPDAPPGGEPQRRPANGAAHAAEIEYALNNLDRVPEEGWGQDDHRVSSIFSRYLVQFIRSGKPNWRPGLPSLISNPTASAAKSMLPDWPVAHEQANGTACQVIGTSPYTLRDRLIDARQLFLQRFVAHRIANRRPPQ
ncbi:carboxylesterase family protein [Trinickia caryophylli]|uniref:Carboxylic ester hydrolase n=1 Tax=Trinickia caryophylli TaxID=28094 RepID=A0A1X7F9U1_TRICW|nr:carboxylesterase family protein [Trinickia caryophylli]PMS10968.1 carboxylesterase family protein [Trinickia caryophylli]TRX18917.1 carboxylesterase family protein [Trinickia caryophylli]WQE10284.1 carboxylesterase family protein [Trinickia caryophylli]SMF48811.1 para-nitrobenzyl esterase [Trinickia caryophylli]GLU34269.1 carboxylic ester hydrolase [Trinickia caryophylli]